MRRAVLVALGLAYAALASGIETLTWTATAAVLLPAIILTIMAVRRPAGEPQPSSVPETRAVKAWTALVLAGLLWEAWAFVHQPAVTVASYAHPSLSSLVGPWLHHRAVRFGGWALWLFSGWRLVLR